MIFDVKNYAEHINKLVKIKFSLFLEDGKLVYGDEKDGLNINTNFLGVKKDKSGGRTLFRFRYHGVEYIGVVQGTGEESANYASLLAELLENYASKGALLSRDDFYKMLISGDIDDNRAKRYMAKYGISNAKAVAILFTCNGKAKEIMDIACTYSASDVAFSALISPDTFVLVKYADSAFGEYHSTNEYANFLWQTIYEESGVKANIDIGGAVESLIRISVSYAQAEDTKRMRQTLNSSLGVHSFKEYMLLNVLEELPVSKLNEFFGLLTDISDNEIYNDAELTTTAEKFLENSLNVSETARKLYLHRNTLIYRLDKLQNETGLDIRNFSDALTFRLIMLIKNLLK